MALGGLYYGMEDKMGGMGGGGKEPKAQKALVGMAQQLFGETGAVRGLLTSQMEEALKTGGVGAQLPIVQKAEERGRVATSQAMRGLEENLARMGLRGTPFGETAVGEQARRGAMEIGQIGPQMTSQFLAQAPGFAGGQTGAALGGMGQAAGVEAQRYGGLLGLLNTLFQAGGQMGASF